MPWLDKDFPSPKIDDIQQSLNVFKEKHFDVKINEEISRVEI